MGPSNQHHRLCTTVKKLHICIIFFYLQCTLTSEAVARRGNVDVFPQISFAASGDSLGHVDDFFYFARTVSADAEQGLAVAGVLQELGLVPFAAVVFSGLEERSVNLKDHFVEAWEDDGHKVLLQADLSLLGAEEVTEALAAVGAPVVVLMLQVAQVNLLFGAAAKNQVTGSASVAWVGVDSWTNSAGLDYELLPSGVVGLLPFNGDTAMKAWYWEAYQRYMAEHRPLEAVTPMTAPFVGQLADAVFALALSFQGAINSHSGLEGSLMRGLYFETLTGAVAFEGVTGSVDFDSHGDLVTPRFSLKNYVQREDLPPPYWVDVGSMVGAVHDGDSPIAFSLKYDLIQWPDGSTGVTTGYSAQLTPHCAAGYEPTFVKDRYECTKCNVNRKIRSLRCHCQPCVLS